MAAVRPAGPEPMIRTFDAVGPPPAATETGPPAIGAAAPPSAMMAIPPPNGLSDEPPAGAAGDPEAAPPKLMPSEPKALVAPASRLLLSVIGGLSFLSRLLS